MSAAGEAAGRVEGTRKWAIAAGLPFALLLCGSGAAQSIHKCKEADGRTTYSHLECHTPRPATAAPSLFAAASGTSPAPADDAPAVFRAPLPKHCDNAVPLQFVVERLTNAATPNDTREFLADERFRLVRCEYMRFSGDERRERDNAMREIEASEPARRQAAIARVRALYNRHLTQPERTARARAQGR